MHGDVSQTTSFHLLESTMPNQAVAELPSQTSILPCQLRSFSTLLSHTHLRFCSRVKRLLPESMSALFMIEIFKTGPCDWEPD